MKKIFTLFVMLAAVLGMQAQDKYVVAGAETLTGENWNADTEVNVMTTTDNGATYTLQKTGVKLKAGNNYEYKVVKDADGNKTWYGTGEDGNANYTVAVAEDGEYTVTFKFDVANTVASAETLKTGEATFEDDVWTLVGSSVLCGKSWDLEDADGVNQFITTDKVTYTLVKEDLILEAGTKNEFKIALNHSWDVAYGKNGTKDNNELTVDETAKYKVTFTFVNDETHLLTAVAEKTGEAVVAEKTWTLAGSGLELFGGEKEWDPENTANDMTKISDGYYELIKHNVNLEAKDYQFKVCANHGWDESYGDNGNNMVMTVENAGAYDVIFTFLSESKTLTAELADPTGINTVKENNAKTAVIYNLQGQRIQEGYHGIAIQNGRKFMMK